VLLPVTLAPDDCTETDPPDFSVINEVGGTLLADEADASLTVFVTVVEPAAAPTP
jgi:hypothetical protein